MVAQDNLEIAYEVGGGVPQDNVLAHIWFNLGAANGWYADAQKMSCSAIEKPKQCLGSE